MDILKEFQGFRGQRADLTQTLDDFSEKLPGKVDLLQNQVHLLTDPETSLLIQDTAPTLMTDQPDTHVSFSRIKRIQNKTLINDSFKENSLNQPHVEQLQNLTNVFPDQITPTPHPHPDTVPSNHKWNSRLLPSQNFLCIRPLLKRLTTCTTLSNTNTSSLTPSVSKVAETDGQTILPLKSRSSKTLCLEAVKWNLQKYGFSQELSDRILGPQCKSNRKLYGARWSISCAWWKSKVRNPLKASTPW